MEPKTRVLVLFGGRSAEHEISIISARFVARSLDPARFEALLVGISSVGAWHLQAAIPEGDAHAVGLDESGPRVVLAPVPQTGRPRLSLEGGGEEPFDVIFPVLHGPLGEDGSIQGLFELAAVPYVGSGVASSAVGMDKIFQKQILAQAEIPVVPYHGLRRHDWDHDRAERRAACCALGYPLFVKPANMGSSLGVHKVKSEADLDAAIEDAFHYDTKLVVERGLAGVREIECAVLGNDDPRVSLPGEITVQHADGFYSYAAKYLDPDGAALDIPARLHATEQHVVQLTALRAFRALDAAGLARVDMFLDENHDLYVNEINSIPGFTAISMYPALWQASGVSPEELVATLVDLALARYRARAVLKTTRD
jgi:D-alanine-D-alanine ligase